MINEKKISIIAGHYGSGKTTVAVNYALWLRQKHQKVSLVDLDVVNPYFRSADSKDVMKEHDIELIASDYVNTNVDIPAISPIVNKIFEVPDLYSVIDVGGDDSGAVALGRYFSRLQNTESKEVVIVVNKYRPLTENVTDLDEILHEIEIAGSIRFTGIINNSNLGVETTADTIYNSVEYAYNISEKTGLPILCTSVKETLVDELTRRGIGNLFPMKIYHKPGWDIF